MINPTKKLTVTAVAHQGSGKITAYVDQLPGLLVQGDSDDDIKAKLTSLLNSYFQKLDSIKNNMEYQTTSLK